ncbi:MAG: phospho-sugar mutase [Bacillota bacterium]|nr:phospho-sugar mutase [Bacillota bacterium]
MEPYKMIYQEWLDNPYFDAAFREELLALAGDEQELEDRFYRDLEFGTAGMRGVIGAGRNRINRYTVRRATQGFANYLKVRQRLVERETCVAIAYDSRRCSRELAEETASVLAANGFVVYLFDDVRTTPQLSYAVRWLRAIGGVMITASHNPPEYNGYKVYDENGCQLVPELAERLTAEVDAVQDPATIRHLPFAEARRSQKIVSVPSALDDDYFEMVRGISLRPLLADSKIRAVYTPLHGTGGPAITRLLKEAGFESLIPVKEQMQPDGEFPTIRTPNPEASEAFDVARNYMSGADLAIATDPDCDRLGLMTGSGKLLTGNQIGCLFLEYILSTRKEQGTLTEDHYVVSTIVSTNLAARIAEHYGVRYIQTLTGFKYIGEQIERDPAHFIMGFEESYGYLFGPEVRDKDAVMATQMAIEMTTFYGGDLDAALARLYEKYGYTVEAMISKHYAGKEGAEQMKRIMADARNPEFSYTKKIDYLVDPTGLTPSDVVKYFIDADSWMVFRPSGTEPKLKVYFSVSAKSEDEANRRLADMRRTAETAIEPRD